uniref:Uncharacterized protein n=1 Tax=Seriola lalandi dorsalis TaxID=1841481 RepID=A0A3B4WYX1_SERLL
GGPQQPQQEPQQEPLQQIGARIIQKAWRRYVCREVFSYFKELISHCNQQDPQSILRAVNPREAELLDAAAGVFIRFRLGGVNLTHRPIADLCASSPKDYAQTGMKRPVSRWTNNSRLLVQQDRSRWYQRVENNSWRLFFSKARTCHHVLPIGANKKKDFHFSRLQRQQDVDSWRKRRKIEWLRHM